MEEFIFWKDWAKKEKYFYYLLFAFFLTTTFWLAFNLASRAINHTGWDVATTIERLPVATQTVTEGILEFPIEADIMYVTQQFKIGEYRVNTNASLIFVLITTLAFNILITAASFFRTWWYYAVLGMFILALTFFKFDLLFIFGDTKNIFLIASIVLFIGLNVVFNLFYSHVDFLFRFLSFLALSVVLGLVIVKGAYVQNPILYLSNYGLYVPFALSIVFIILIAFDLIFFFLYIITSSKSATGRSNSLNFVLISLLYLGNLALMYCKKTGIVNWDLLYIDEFLLLFVSIIVGVWTYKMRLQATSNMMDFAPYGAIFYLGMAITTIATIAFCVATNNDQLIATLRDAVLYSHLAIGSMFLIYVIFNFSTYINRNLKVYEVVLKINRFPVHLVRVGGLVLATGLLVKGNFKQIYKTEAGYAAGIADVYLEEQNILLAEEFLKESLFHDPITEKSNLAYASLKETNGRYEDAADHYKKIQLNEETEQLYASIAYNYSKVGLAYSAIETLHEGITKFPKSSQLYNNLGVVFTKTHILDSTFHFLNRAEALGGSVEVSKTNMLSFLIKKKLVKELPDYFNENSAYLPLETNKIAISLMRKEAYSPSYIYPAVADTIGKIDRLAYHYNFGMSALTTIDTIFDSFTSNYLKNDSLAIFTNELGLLKAYKKYYSGNRREAFKELFDLQKENSSKAGFYFNTLGLWSLQNNAPLLAADFFNQALDNGNTTSRINQVMAVLTAGQKENGLAMLQELLNSPDETERKLAHIIDSNFKLKTNATDNDRLDYLKTNKTNLTTGEFEAVYDGITDLEIRKQASVLLLAHYINTKNLTKAKFIPLSKDLSKKDENRVNILRLELTRLLADYKNLLTMVDSVALNQEDESQRLFYKAVALEFTGKKEESQKIYKEAIVKLPLHQPLILAYANFLKKYETNEVAYNTLLDAVLLNPYGIEIQKAYCLMALEINLDSYANETLEKIKSLTSKSDFEQFNTTFVNTKKKIESSFNWK